MALPILKTKCSADFVNPAKGITKLPINCADHDSDDWNWNYFWTKTIGTTSPQLENGTTRSPADMYVIGKSYSGQTVIRAMFAYIATDAFSGRFTLKTSTQEHEGQNNFTLIAKLYKENGEVVSTFVENKETEATSDIELPATVCPKILWLGAATQPYAGDNAPKDYVLPETDALITFSRV